MPPFSGTLVEYSSTAGAMVQTRHAAAPLRIRPAATPLYAAVTCSTPLKDCACETGSTKLKRCQCMGRQSLPWSDVVRSFRMGWFRIPQLLEHFACQQSSSTTTTTKPKSKSKPRPVPVQLPRPDDAIAAAAASSPSPPPPPPPAKRRKQQRAAAPLPPPADDPDDPMPPLKLPPPMMLTPWNAVAPGDEAARYIELAKAAGRQAADAVVVVAANPPVPTATTATTTEVVALASDPSVRIQLTRDENGTVNWRQCTKDLDTLHLCTQLVGLSLLGGSGGGAMGVLTE